MESTVSGSWRCLCVQLGLSSLEEPTYLQEAIMRSFSRHSAATMIMLLALLSSPPLSMTENHPLQRDIQAYVDSEYDGLFQLYRHLHANPELSFQEGQTAQRIQQELRNAGFEVTGNIGGHG